MFSQSFNSTLGRTNDFSEYEIDERYNYARQVEVYFAFKLNAFGMSIKSFVAREHVAGL